MGILFNKYLNYFYDLTKCIVLLVTCVVLPLLSLWEHMQEPCVSP